MVFNTSIYLYQKSLEMFSLLGSSISCVSFAQFFEWTTIPRNLILKLSLCHVAGALQIKIKFVFNSSCCSSMFAKHCLVTDGDRAGTLQICMKIVKATKERLKVNSESRF